MTKYIFIVLCAHLLVIIHMVWCSMYQGCWRWSWCDVFSGSEDRSTWSVAKESWRGHCKGFTGLEGPENNSPAHHPESTSKDWCYSVSIVARY